MSLAGAKTYTAATDIDTKLSVGFESESKTLVAPFGIGMQTEMVDVDIGVTGHYGHHFSVSASRASDSHYEYSFNFEYDFSTSSDPFIAGAASDVIIGGGVDLVVNEAIEGFFSKSFCLLMTFLDTYLLVIFSCSWNC
jgi:hypothetical protein